ncbi:site-specific recombinase [Herbaspirillum sp. alder98]|uniref:site-specific recombinase n=1 Tax=Herbaspirillum sp. alder98 TaxID=2913096 RepID=UPI001CD90952|nr:site-specific recombinase [Herbaspirillum sp. alder98]MCA1326619.1 site-specific recombinase [Herbaspirillum sp. alder98]
MPDAFAALAALDAIASAPLSTDLGPLTALADSLRPADPADADAALASLRALDQLLRDQPHYAAALHQHLLHQLSVRRQVGLYADTGILSNDGFLHELLKRLTYRLLPPALDPRKLEDCLDLVFHDPHDTRWLCAVSLAQWQALWQTLQGAAPAGSPAPGGVDLLQAIQVLSYRISAIGMEPELLRIYDDVRAFESPFLMQNVELHQWLQSHRQALQDRAAPADDARHLLVLLDQCQHVIDRIRRQAQRIGTSISLTYRLLRLEQNLQRLRQLLALVEPPAPDERAPLALALMHELAAARAQQYSVRQLLAGNINLLARNVTENASRTGEHYIAETRSEYVAMYRSAAGAGFIIGFMALIKIMMSWLRAAPLVEAFLYSLNYSLGFMLIHVLHFTVATKQPAMTASRIAADIHRIGNGRDVDLDSLCELIARVWRTQFIAVLGNLSLAFPVAWLLASLYHWLSGHHFVDAAKAAHLLHDLDPVNSLALFHAAIAGVCLFLAGLISGYYDNKALYTNIAQRVVRARWLVSLLGLPRAQRLGNYVETGLGGLMGNFTFGIMLGSIGTIGFMLGLPIDIRHITFSAANLAIAMDALDWAVGPRLFLLSAAGVLTVGLVNLWVSFSLALWVALRSRQVRFAQTGKLLRALLARLLTRPAQFFWPPAETASTPPADVPK